MYFLCLTVQFSSRFFSEMGNDPDTEALLCAVRIETLHCMISERINDELISEEQLQKLINDKTDFITGRQQTIWLNQLTQTISGPLYYSFEG